MKLLKIMKISLFKVMSLNLEFSKFRSPILKKTWEKAIKKSRKLHLRETCTGRKTRLTYPPQSKSEPRRAILMFVVLRT